MPHPSPANGLAPPLPADGKTALTRALALALLLHAAGAALLWGMSLTSAPLPLPQGEAVQVALLASANGLANASADAGDKGRAGNGGSAGTTPAQAAELPPAAQAAPAPPEQATPAPPEQARRTTPDTTPHPATRQKPPRRDRGHNGAREKAHTGSATGIPSQATPGTEGTEGAGAQGGSSGRGTGHGMPAGQAPTPLGQGVNPRPRYPELARQRGQEGVVLLRVQVDARGMPTHVLVQQSSGHSLLDDAARDAVRRWRFSPARRLGRPVPGVVAVPVHFRLR